MKQLILRKAKLPERRIWLRWWWSASGRQLVVATCKDPMHVLALEKGPWFRPLGRPTTSSYCTNDTKFSFFEDPKRPYFSTSKNRQPIAHQSPLEKPAVAPDDRCTVMIVPRATIRELWACMYAYYLPKREQSNLGCESIRRERKPCSYSGNPSPVATDTTTAAWMLYCGWWTVCVGCLDN